MLATPIIQGIGEGVAAATGLADHSRRFAAACEELHDIPDRSLVGAVQSLEEAQRALDSSRLALVAELDARDEPRRRTGLNTPGWIGHDLGWSRPASGRCVATARKLRTLLPLVADALRDGRLHVEHAHLLARLAHSRVAPIVEALQNELIALSVGVRFEQWAREARALIDLADIDGGHHPSPECNRLSASDGLDGELHLDVDLVGAAAASVRASLLEEADRRFRHHQRLRTADSHHQMPSRSQLLAEALTELVSRGAATRPGTRAPVTDVTLIIGATDPVVGTTPDGVRLSDGVTRRLLCDAVVTPVIVDSLGVPLDMGTALRLFTKDQRRAAMVRDGGCVHPGCDAPAAWTHLHHTHQAHLGGATDLHLGASGCPGHHTLWHTADWDIRPDPDRTGRFLIITPTGRILRSQQHGRIPQDE